MTSITRAASRDKKMTQLHVCTVNSKMLQSLAIVPNQWVQRYLLCHLMLTVLPAKSDSYVMFCLHSYRDLKSTDHECINPIRRIGLMHM